MTSKSLNTVDNAVLAFRKRIEASSAGFLLTNTPVCPCSKMGHLKHFVQAYTFNADDLLSRIGHQVVVHHGAIPDELGPHLHLLYNASPIVYAHRALGSVSLSLPQMREIIEGNISDWGVIGDDSKPIQLFCHAGEIQKAVLKAVASQIFQARHLCNSFTGCASYESLATNASEHDGSLVFGLRPEFAPSDLMPVSVGGRWPGMPVDGNKYPFLQVWLSVPRGRSFGDLARYLDLVAHRIEMDVVALRKLSEHTLDWNAPLRADNSARFLQTPAQAEGQRLG